jgi:hypothetical protein
MKKFMICLLILNINAVQANIWEVIKGIYSGESTDDAVTTYPGPAKKSCYRITCTAADNAAAKNKEKKLALKRERSDAENHG